MMVVS